MIATAFVVQGAAAMAALRRLLPRGLPLTVGSLARLVAAAAVALLPVGLTWMAVELVRYPM